VVVVLVECRPAAVRRLHRERPRQRIVDRTLQPLAVGIAAAKAGQHRQCDGRVVDVRVVQVGPLERPAAGRRVRHLDAPVAGHADLLLEHPLDRAAHTLALVQRAIAVLHRHQRQQRVPHRRFARLDVDRAVALVGPVRVQRFDPSFQHRVLERVAFLVQREQAVDPRRLDTAPGAVLVLMLDHPLKHEADGRRTSRRDAEVLIGVQRAIGLQEHFAPRARTGARHAVVEILPPLGKQLVEARLRRQRSARATGAQHAQRQHRGARPRRKVVDVEGHPLRQEDDLRRQIRCALPRPLTDQRQPVAREHAQPAEPAVSEDPLSGSDHHRIIGPVAPGTQRRVTLDRGIDVATRRVEIGLPGAVLALFVQQRSDQPLALGRIVDAEEVHRQQPLGLDARVGLEHADPEAVCLLVFIQPCQGAIDRTIEAAFREAILREDVRYQASSPFP
jgi:hypothetical protein